MGERQRTADRIIAVNARWKDVIDTVLKLGGASWLVMSILSWLLVNRYLRAIGQPGLAPGAGGSWGIVALLGLTLTLSMSGSAASFAWLARLVPVGHRRDPTTIAVRLAFLGAATFAVGATFGFDMLGGPPVAALGAGAVAGVVAGLLFIKMVSACFHSVRPGMQVRTSRLLVMLACWTLGASLMFMLLAANLDMLSRMGVHESAVPWSALGVSLLDMGICSLLEWSMAVPLAAAATSTSVLWFAPGTKILVLIALDVANIGGGMPVGAAPGPRSAQTCNLGTLDRPVLYRSEPRCSRRAALEEFRRMSALAKNP